MGLISLEIEGCAEFWNYDAGKIGFDSWLDSCTSKFLGKIRWIRRENVCSEIFEAGRFLFVLGTLALDYCGSGL